jgi:hypothetical protein
VYSLLGAGRGLDVIASGYEMAPIPNCQCERAAHGRRPDLQGDQLPPSRIDIGGPPPGRVGIEQRDKAPQVAQASDPPGDGGTRRSSRSNLPQMPDFEGPLEEAQERLVIGTEIDDEGW